MTEGFGSCALAAAQPDLLRFGHRELSRSEFGGLVRAVAERLALGLPAGTPPVVAGRKLHRERGLLRNHRLGHRAPSVFPQLNNILSISMAPVPASSLR